MTLNELLVLEGACERIKKLAKSLQAAHEENAYLRDCISELEERVNDYKQQIIICDECKQRGGKR